MKEELIEKLEKDFYEGLELIKPRINGHHTAINLIVDSFEEAIQALQQREGDKKEHAIEFGKWITDNSLRYATDDIWLACYIVERTTNQLYNEYIKSLPTPPNK